ncbi:MAG: hypothetical protein ALECFALPRED_006682, partial [Alectoria fallacina]
MENAPEGGNQGVLNIFDVFFGIKSALSKLAARDKASCPHLFYQGLKGSNGGMSISSLSRSKPPYLEVQWILVAMSRIPVYMLDEIGLENRDVEIVGERGECPGGAARAGFFLRPNAPMLSANSRPMP